MRQSHGATLLAGFLAMLPIAARGADHTTLSLDPFLTLDAAASGEKVTSPPADGTEGYGLTGNGFGARNRLAAQGLFFAGFVQLDTTKVLRGGLDTEAWPIRYLLDLHLTADTHAFGLPGGTVFFDFQSHDQSENGDRAVGDIQGFDNIESVRFVQIIQFWYKQRLADGVSLKVGKIDANADASLPGADPFEGFSLIEHSTEFLQSAAVYPSSMFPMVTYPDPAPGLQLFLGTSSLYAGLGAFYSNAHQTFLNLMGHPEHIERTSGGMFFIGELGLRYPADSPVLHAGVGAWYHNGEFPRIAMPESMATGAGGAYFFLDHTLFHDETAAATRDLGVFFNAGIADSRTSPMDASLALGISGKGFIPARPGDAFGLIGAWTRLPEQPGLLHPFELATELYYKFQITPWASLKPSFAYIFHPSGINPDAAVITVRAQVDF